MDGAALRPSRSAAFSIAAATPSVDASAASKTESDEKERDSDDDDEVQPSGDARLSWLVWLARRGTRAAVAALRLAVALHVDENALRTAVVPMLYQLGAQQRLKALNGSSACQRAMHR